MAAIGGLGSTTATAFNRHPGLFHQTTYLEAPHVIPFVPELFGHATTAITVMRLFGDRLDTLKQSDLLRAQRGFSLTFKVVIKPAAPNP
jgi:hypothetical protein